jgi:hypothetical protein
VSETSNIAISTGKLSFISVLSIVHQECKHNDNVSVEHADHAGLVLASNDH